MMATARGPAAVRFACQPTRLPYTVCSGTMRTCENGGPTRLPFSGGEFPVFGRRVKTPTPLPFLGGEYFSWHIVEN